LGTRGLDRRSRLAAGQARSAAQSSAEHDRDLAQAPGDLLEEIKIAAHKCDVPYQSLIKIWLSEKVW
jgi:CopG antitoxin of type II toxin-antitoxin system